MVQPAKSFRYTMVYLVHDLSDRGKFLKTMVQPAKTFSHTMVFLVRGTADDVQFPKKHGTASQIHPLYHAHRLSAPRRYLEIALEPWYRWTFSLPIPCSRGSRHSLTQDFSKKAWYRETLFSPVPCPPAFVRRHTPSKTKKHGTEKHFPLLYHAFCLQQPDIRNRFSQIHGTASQIHPLYHAHRLSAPRHDLEIALEPWYRWTFSLPIPCPRRSRHSPSQDFSKKAWYRETLSSPVPCPPAFVSSRPQRRPQAAGRSAGRRSSNPQFAVRYQPQSGRRASCSTKTAACCQTAFSVSIIIVRSYWGGNSRGCRSLSPYEYKALQTLFRII